MQNNCVGKGVSKRRCGVSIIEENYGTVTRDRCDSRSVWDRGSCHIGIYCVKNCCVEGHVSRAVVSGLL